MYLKSMSLSPPNASLTVEMAREAILLAQLEPTQAFLRRAPGLALAVDESGYSLLHHACYLGGPDIVQALFQAGASPFRPDPDGLSPIQAAALKGRHEALWRLAELGVKAPAGEPLTAHTRRGPLAEAIKGGHLESARALLSMGFFGSPCGGQADCPWSELFRLSRRPGWGAQARLAPGDPAPGSPALFDAFGRLLIDSGLPLSLTDPMGNGLAFFAAMYQNCPALRWLGALGAPLDAPNHSGIRALWACCRDGKIDAARTLVALGADPLAPGPDSESCSAVAARHRHALIAAEMEALEIAAAAGSSRSGGSSARSL